jgi:hypothetical protein
MGRTGISKSRVGRVRTAIEEIDDVPALGASAITELQRSL